jgi:ABC-2 type transport system permease protein
MFLKIFLFEIQNRIRRPAFYLYFFAVLLFTLFAFATGALPVAEKEHINSPFLITFWCAGITMMMMLISSSVMGAAIYRDIEYQTKDYYLTYPITKPGYFWGRYLGSFIFMLFIALAILLGIYFGTIIGPLIGKTDRAQYGPNHLIYYLYPFFTIALPNLFFTSSLFFGLVAITRNVKVIYFGGILLFLFYFIALFFLNHTNNTTVIGISDPFGMNGVRYQMNNATATEQNNNLILISGPMAINRIIWPGLGLVILLFTYIRFNFEKFFSGKRDKAAIDDINIKATNKVIKIPAVSFAGKYERRVLSNLIKLELLNIIRDNYFWIIVGSGSIFLGFVFWLGERNYGIPDLPRTVMLLSIFNDAFPFFIFFIIMFYTGETLQRDRLTRYAFINDSLPPPNWVLNGSKLIPLLIIGAGLSFIPLVIGVIVQLAKGYTELYLAVYFSYILIILLPKLLLIVVFCYLVHVIINNKFAAYAVGVTLWIGFFFLELTGIFNYHLLLYSYTPNSGLSDMDGMGHMVGPISWFNLYWLLGGGILIIVAALFYYRGVSSSFKERLRLIPERFDKKTKLFTVGLIPLFLIVGAYNYYNVSYLNNYLSKDEQEDRAIIYEKALKKYQSLPLPKVTRIKMNVDIFPDKQQEFVKAQVTVVNKTDKPISKMLLDADGLNYSIAVDGKPVPFTNPLFYSRGFFNWFRPKQDTADFRLYQLRRPLAPGDSAVLEINSSVTHTGFTNSLYSTNLLHNGTFFTGGLPGLGYDDDDEVGSPYVRKKAGLPPKTAESEIPQNDLVGIKTLKAGKSSDLLSLDVTVSTSGDQIVVTHGELVKQWKQNGRNYFHYIQDKPGMYVPFGIISARFTDSRDSIMLDHKIYIDVYHHPTHNENTTRFINAYKEGLKYYSSVYGPYPFKNIRLAETSTYGPRESSTTTLDTYAEYNSWNAHFTNPNEFDYLYFATTRNLAQQWWRFQVAPNNTVGSLVIPEGLANFDALVMAEKKYGKANMRAIVLDQLWYYLFVRRRLEEREHPLIRANQWFEWSGKASVAMYGLRNLIGEDSLNNALREFKNAYAFKSQPPFAGTNDLYHYLQKHVPDSLQYYMTDTWQKVTLYDSKVNTVTATKIAGKNKYKVTLKVNINKVWIDSKGNDVSALKMNDYIDIGIFAADTNDKNGRNQANLLYLKKYKLTRGEHQLAIIVKGKPNAAGVDPFGTLIDRNPNDNMKTIDHAN